MKHFSYDLFLRSAFTGSRHRTVTGLRSGRPESLLCLGRGHPGLSRNVYSGVMLQKGTLSIIHRRFLCPTKALSIIAKPRSITSMPPATIEQPPNITILGIMRAPVITRMSHMGITSMRSTMPRKQVSTTPTNTVKRRRISRSRADTGSG